MRRLIQQIRMVAYRYKYSHQVNVKLAYQTNLWIKILWSHVHFVKVRSIWNIMVNKLMKELLWLLMIDGNAKDVVCCYNWNIKINLARRAKWNVNFVQELEVYSNGSSIMDLKPSGYFIFLNTVASLMLHLALPHYLSKKQ